MDVSTNDSIPYRTVGGDSQVEYTDKKSRFISRIAHVKTPEQAMDFVAKVKSEFHDAKHHVFAYRIYAGNTVKYTDDGEPQRTAGLPTLDIILHAGITDVVIVTTRYFGGTLLGTGGLVRAYTKAAQAALDNNKILEFSRLVRVSIVIPYAFYDQLHHALLSMESVSLESSTFEENVALECVVKQGYCDFFVEEVEILTHRNAIVTKSEVYQGVFNC